MRKKYVKGEISLEELLRNTSEGPTGCLEWTASTARNGYGQVRRNKKIITVTRLVMHFVYGFDFINDKRFVLHTCDNPGCIKPEHLYIGTARDNMSDKVKRDRHNRGQRVWNAKLFDHDIVDIFKRRNRGESVINIAKYYQMPRSSIYLILQRKAWKHVKLNQTITALTARKQRRISCS